MAEGIFKLLGRTLGENIEIETKFNKDIPSITVDPNNLQNAVLNLAINAKAAMPKGGVLTVGTALKHLDEDLSMENGGLPAGEYVEFSVKDTGCGMSPEILEHAIEPFFTTKDVGEGSGLGLSMVYGFVRQSGGYVTLASEAGKGTTVRMLFPVAEALAVQQEEKRAAAEVRGGTGTILVVEDEERVRRVTVKSLAGVGYTVLEACNGQEALALIDEKAVAPDLLITDVVMPAMGGEKLAEKYRRRFPASKILFISGYLDEALQKNSILESGIELLQKPFMPEELAQRVQKLLSTPETAKPDEQKGKWRAIL